MNDLHIVTVATETKFYFPYLIESCKKNGKELVVLGYNKKWKGFAWRLKLLINYFKSLNSDDIVCFIDGYDVICNRNLKNLKDQFICYKKKYDFKIIIAIDNYRFKLQEISAELYFKKCVNQLLNAGTYIGYAGDLSLLLLAAYNLDPDDNNDDQYLLTRSCNMDPSNFFFDENQDFFLTIHKPFHNINNELTFVNTIAYYKEKQPYFIHAPSCTYLSNIIVNLGYNISNSEIIIIEKNLKKNSINKILYYIRQLTSNICLVFLILIVCIYMFINFFKIIR
jgi:hypothetical protein